jgi:hypothetical protein
MARRPSCQSRPEPPTRRACTVYDKQQSRLRGEAFERGNIRLVGGHLHLRFRMVDEVENVFAQQWAGCIRPIW